MAMPIFMYTTYVLYDRSMSSILQVSRAWSGLANGLAYGGKRTKTVCSGERGETR